MTQEERFGTRDRTYSAWHRRYSTQRFCGIDRAQTLAMIDLDASLYVEYDDGSKEPLALIETAQDVGQDYKNATVTKKLAMRTQPVIPAYILLYKISRLRNPAAKEYPDIEQFRYRRIWPEPETTWVIASPGEWCKLLVRLREWSARKLDQKINAERAYAVTTEIIEKQNEGESNA